MRTELSVMRLIEGDRIDVFNYFVTPNLVEQWGYPDGMTLKVPVMVAAMGGNYRFEHTDNKGGVWVCEGNFKDFQPGSKLVQVDKISDPDGNVIFPRLETVTTFSQKPGGTFVTITQRGFANERDIDQCEIGWNQSLDKLASLFVGFQHTSP